MVPCRSHNFVMVSVFQVQKCNEKIKEEHVISLVPLKVMPQNHKICNFLAFSYRNMHLCLKGHISPGSGSMPRRHIDFQRSFLYKLLQGMLMKRNKQGDSLLKVHGALKMLHSITLGKLLTVSFSVSFYRRLQHTRNF